MLMGVEIPEGQGNTIFSSGFNAYKKLPENVKKKIENAKGVFSSAGPISKTRIELEKRAGVSSAKVFKLNTQLCKKCVAKNLCIFLQVILIEIKIMKKMKVKKLKNFY